jgi:hypothetical protein
LFSNGNQVYGVKNRGGSDTQNHDYPDGHSKSMEKDALEAKKSFA